MTNLAALIAPHSMEEFLLNSWPHHPFVVHGLSQSIKTITSISQLQSLDSLLKHWPNQVQAHLPDVKDESSAVDINAKDAKKLYANGMGLLFNNIQNFLPELMPWLQGIQKDLGLPHSTFARCIVYATPDGKGTAAHFDQNINFVLQLQGTKKWKIAANLSVENPMQRFTMGQPLDPELAAYSQATMPTEMPLDFEEITLRPGSLLFVPRGFWHSTEADGEALALNFTFSQPTWIDLFTMALRSRLSLSSEWRELADGVSSSDPNRRNQAQLNFNALLMELAQDIPNWNAEDILAATEGDLGEPS